ncbi:MAG: hypothetical protein QNJ38_12455 [Prochloraceae cyanobacterium]|nr:hypothetical protein [Prochloraceae cyanobacterium]
MEENKIQWQKIRGIVAVQGSITLSWVIYSLYLPDLLVQLGFTKALAGTILIIEHFLEMAIEPIFGNLSDRSLHDLGTREPWIKLGVILAATFFIILPIIGFLISGLSFWRWILPIIAVLWASAMAIFRSPVIALLTLATPQPKLPIAASYLTLTQQLIGAFRFTAYNAIVAVGPLFAFAIGSFSLLGAAAFLRQVTPHIAPKKESQTLPNISPQILAMISLIGIAIGFGLRFLFAGLARVLTINGGNVSLGMLGFSITIAGFAIPTGWLAFKLGNTRIVLAGLLLTAILLQIISLNISTAMLLIAAILIAFTFSTVLNGIVPFILEVLPTSRAGLGIGLYFGSFGGAISFFDLFFKQVNNINLQTNLGAIALIFACFSIALSLRIEKA